MVPLIASPQYVIETPRAGNRGHRYIVPLGCPLTFADVERFARAVTECPYGGNFIAMSEDVTQEFSNGTVRSGVEWLILVGVEVHKLSVAQRTACQQRLTRRRADVTRLVKDQINWSLEGHGLLIEREELNFWAQLDELNTLPTSPSAIPDVHIRLPRSSRWLVIASLCAALLVGGTAIALQYPTQSKPLLATATTPTTAPSSLVADQPDDHSSATRQILKKLVSEKTLSLAWHAIEQADIPTQDRAMAKACQDQLSEQAQHMLEQAEQHAENGEFHQVDSLLDQLRLPNGSFDDRLCTVQGAEQAIRIERVLIAERDRKAYERIRSTSRPQSDQFAQEYLEMSPTGRMAEEVRAYLDKLSMITLNLDLTESTLSLKDATSDDQLSWASPTFEITITLDNVTLFSKTFSTRDANQEGKICPFDAGIIQSTAGKASNLRLEIVQVARPIFSLIQRTSILRIDNDRAIQPGTTFERKIVNAKSKLQGTIRVKVVNSEVPTLPPWQNR
jgi:hypothetical protein